MASHIDSTLYDLEKEYKATFVMREWNITSNPETGEKVKDKKQWTIIGIQLPRTLARKFFYDVGYLRANSNFTYGATNDFKDIILIVRKTRLPHIALDLNRDVVFENKRYDVAQIDDFDGAWAITLKHVEGSVTYNEFNVGTSDRVSLGDNN